MTQGPNLVHCARCNLDYPVGLLHPLEECNNRVREQKQWPPTTMETKGT